MRRFRDWPLRLRAAIEDARHRPFDWATHNCGFFVADTVLALTGVDPGAEFRGRYRTRRGAYAAVRRATGGGMHALACRAFGDPLPTPGLAGRGDVALLDSPSGEALGIVLGEKIAVTGPHGLEFLPRSVAKAAWRI